MILYLDLADFFPTQAVDRFISRLKAVHLYDVMPRPMLSTLLCYAASITLAEVLKKSLRNDKIEVDLTDVSPELLLDRYPLYSDSFLPPTMSSVELAERLTSPEMCEVWTELVKSCDYDQLFLKLVVCGAGTIRAYRYYKVNAILCGMDEPIIQVTANRLRLPGLG